jgi:uncharacterized protein (TIGR02284 family)
MTLAAARRRTRIAGTAHAPWPCGRSTVLPASFAPPHQKGPVMDQSDQVETLNDLIEISRDGESGFKACAERVKEPSTAVLLRARADECRQAVAELKGLVAQLGGKAGDSGTVTGALHRGWVAVKGSLSGDTDHAVLEETERGEDAAMAAYRKALEENLSAPVRAVVSRQFEGVKRNHLQIRALRDRASLD